VVNNFAGKDLSLVTEIVLVKDGVVFNHIIACPQFVLDRLSTVNAAFILEDLETQPAIGWTWDGDTFVNPNLVVLTLDEVKAARSEEITRLASELAASRYPLPRSDMLLGMLILAIAHGLTNRAQYIGTALTWGGQLAGMTDAAKAQVAAATTPEEVDAVPFDLTTIAAADPAITIPGLLAITD
jgi:hypothetical protein